MSLEQEQEQEPAQIEARIESPDEGSPNEELPVLTVRDTVVFPGAQRPNTVGRPS